MMIPDVATDTIAAAVNGDIDAMDALLRMIDSGIYNLSLRMLGNPDDARDACQEILLKVVTHLAGFRTEAAFSTWVYRIAHNHLLNAVTRSREHPTVSFESIAAKLEQGLEYGQRAIPIELDSGAMTPEDKTAAASIAIGCTQRMLMALDREQRLAYLLDVIFGLNSDQAAEIVGITSAAFRKRLSRARNRLHGFAQRTCGLIDPDHRCHCSRQIPAIRARDAAERANAVAPQTHTPLSLEIAAKSEFANWRAFGDAAALFRSHPDYRAPGEMTAAIKKLLLQHGYLAK